MLNKNNQSRITEIIETINNSSDTIEIEPFLDFKQIIVS
jgi:hypothetical protein